MQDDKPIGGHESKSKLTDVGVNVLNKLSFPVFTTDRFGKLLFLNEPFRELIRKLTGREPKTGFNILVEEDGNLIFQKIAECHRKVNENEKRNHISESFFLYNRYFRIELQYTETQLKSEPTVVGSITDITAGKSIEKKLEDRQRELISLMNNLPGIAFRCQYDENWTMLFMSPVCKELTGYDADEIIGNKKTAYNNLILPEDRKAVKKQVDEAVKNKNRYQIEYRILTKNGTIKWVFEQAKAYINNGVIEFIEGIILDITSRKYAEIAQKAVGNVAELSMQEIDFDDEVFFSKVRDLISGFIHAEYFSVLYYEYDKETLTPLYSSDQTLLDDLKNAKDHTQTISYKVLEEGKPVLLDNDDIFNMIDTGEIRDYGTEGRQWMGIPMDLIRRNKGLVILQNYDSNITYTLRDLESMKLIVHQLSLAINRRDAVEAMRKAKEKAEQNDRLKSTFLANMSHEIRSPMNAIMGFSDLLKDTDLEQKRKERFIALIHERGNDLLRIIDDIIDFSRLEANSLKLNYKRVYLSDFLENLQLSMIQERKRQQKESIHFFMETDPDLRRVSWKTDAVRLRQILMNFYSNALKFTDNGYVKLLIKYASEDQICFSVHDTGIGIPEDQQKYIFERFRQVDMEYKSSRSGTGLGLSISKYLAEKMQGSIKMESEPGKGTVLYLYLPLLEKEKQHIPNNIKEDADSINESKYVDKNILIVEDNFDNYLFLKTAVERLKVNVNWAKNAGDTLNAVQSVFKPDLILMDIRLHGISGLDLTKIIKEKYPEIPVIAQTAYAQQDDREKAMKSGCDDYISKPISLELLWAMVKKYLDK